MNSNRFTQEERAFIAAYNAEGITSRVRGLAKRVLQTRHSEPPVDQFEALMERFAERPLPRVEGAPTTVLADIVVAHFNEHSAGILKDIAKARRAIKLTAQLVFTGAAAAVSGNYPAAITAGMQAIGSAMDAMEADAETQGTLASTVADVVAATHQSGDEIAPPTPKPIRYGKKT